MKKREEKGDDGQEEVEHELVVIFIFILFYSFRCRFGNCCAFHLEAISGFSTTWAVRERSCLGKVFPLSTDKCCFLLAPRVFRSSTLRIQVWNVFFFPYKKQTIFCIAISYRINARFATILGINNIIHSRHCLMGYKCAYVNREDKLHMCELIACRMETSSPPSIHLRCLDVCMCVVSFRCQQQREMEWSHVICTSPE